jgi:hypothetical protein
MNTPNLSISSLSTEGGSRARRLLLLASLASLVLWFIPGASYLTYPFMLLVTFIHEGGHALMAVLTGGTVEAIRIHADTSGVAYTSGGWNFLIYQAGYLGATLFGAFSLILNSRSGRGRAILIVMLTAVALITAIWTRNLFGVVSGGAIVVLLAAGARLLSAQAADFLAAFLAVQLCLNALFDLRNLLWITAYSSLENDAANMARDYFLPAWLWASLWAVGAAIILFGALRIYWRDSR